LDPNFDVFLRYKAAAWLFSQEVITPGTRALGIYEYAAWELFLNPAHAATFNSALGSIDSVDPVTHHTFQFDVGQALTSAQIAANYNSVDLTQWKLVSPVPPGKADSVQEFLTPVPEPSAVVLLVTVIWLAGLIFACERRRRVRKG
jgi:hypothetical protein